MRRLSALLLAVSVGGGCGGPQHVALDPVPVQDDDRYDIPAPDFLVRDDYYDIMDYTLFKPIESLFDLPRDFRALAGKPKQALNVTPLDEIQDSTWFTNRMGRRQLTLDELRLGPDRPLGPDLDDPWTIVGGKTQGVTPGFTIEDARGDRFVIKFDPASNPELATGAEAIGTRIFWAVGYNVPENYLVNFRPENLRISPKATVKLELDKRRPFTSNDLDLILSKVPKNPDGSIRAIASRYLSGKPIGPIPFLGVRKDDPNDVIPHEHRRELRAYRVFCSWVNHNDSREINTLDMYVEEDGRHFVKHHLIDFGAILGSGSTGQNLRSEGFEYQFDLGMMAKSIVTLGLYPRPWTDVDFPVIHGVGRFEASHFDPENWKPNYPYPPFGRMTPRDAFWAAKIIMRFDDARLRSIVESARYSDPRATTYLTRMLAERRDRIGRTWFSRVNPIDEFEVVQMPSAASAESGPAPGVPSTSAPDVVPGSAKAGGPAGGPELRFADLAVLYGFEPPRSYRVAVRDGRGHSWGTFETDAPAFTLAEFVKRLGSPSADAVDARLLQFEIRSRRGNGWSPRTTVILYLEPAGTLRVAAVERDES
jgi:hypothetical protein